MGIVFVVAVVWMASRRSNTLQQTKQPQNNHVNPTLQSASTQSVVGLVIAETQTTCKTKNTHPDLVEDQTMELE